MFVDGGGVSGLKWWVEKTKSFVVIAGDGGGGGDEKNVLMGRLELKNWRNKSYGLLRLSVLPFIRLLLFTLLFKEELLLTIDATDTYSSIV